MRGLAEIVAAAASLCAGSDLPDAGKVSGTPLWIFQGAQDTGMPVQQARDMTAAIRNAGGSARYTEYPDLAHNIWERTYSSDQFWKWLFEQKR